MESDLQPQEEQSAACMLTGQLDILNVFAYAGSLVQARLHICTDAMLTAVFAARVRGKQ